MKKGDSKAKLDIYPSKREELDEIIELIHEFDYPFEKDRFEWKYFDNPWDSISVTARQQGKIVGLLGYIVHPYYIKGKKYFISFSTDAIVRKDLRLKGIYSNLHTIATKIAVEKKIKYNIAFPNKNTYHAGLKAGYQNMGYIPLYLKALNVKEVLRGIGKSYLKPFAGIIKGTMFRNKKPNLNAGIKVKKVKTVPKGLNELWNKVLKDPGRKFQNIGYRKAEFFDWRFVKCPDRKYTMLTAYDEKNKLRGYTILLEASVEGLTEGVILDLFHKPDDRDTCMSLISHATDIFTDTDLDIIGFLWSDTPSCIPDCMKAFGYRRFVKWFNPRPWAVFLRDPELKVIQEDLLEPKKWFISWADCDVF